MVPNIGFLIKFFILCAAFGLMFGFVPEFSGRTFAETQGLSGFKSSQLSQYLVSFYSDTAATMKRTPTKWDTKTGLATTADTPFRSQKEKFKYYHFNQANSSSRFELVLPSAPRTNDLVENLVQVPNILRSLQAMEDANLTAQDLPNLPWSDSYWPDDLGMIGRRYADPYYPNSDDWQTNFNFIQDNPATVSLSQGNPNNLAPSEKYDALVGDSQGSLTSAVWSSIESLGSIASWEGICDGWSAASVSYAEPIHAVTLQGVSGVPIRFYPSDVKALSALLWAKGQYPMNFLGALCDQIDPPRDENGRAIAPECQGNNPGTWHMAVVNQLGQAKRALIIDASNDSQIWNFPMWHYKYSYFNPQTLQTSGHWSDAVIAYDQFTIDKFKKYRASRVRYVVGIGMEISYMIEVTPTHYDGPVAVSRSVQYVYDLELDDHYQIIGGEWYTSVHPDFIWTPRLGAKVSSSQDSAIEDPAAWKDKNAFPSSWAKPASVASQGLQPLAAVVEQLVRFSHAARD